MLDFQDDEKALYEYIQVRIFDKQEPIYKIIGYYLDDEKAKHDLNAYFNPKVLNRYLRFMIALNIMILGLIICWCILRDIMIIYKTIAVIVTLFIGYEINLTYSRFLKESYRYRFVYVMLQKIPKDKLEALYLQASKTMNRI